jgi:hypothetical protein
MVDPEAHYALTRALLTPLITRPVPKPHLLRRPPFRFLCDTVAAVTAATGFARGLYTPAEVAAARGQALQDTQSAGGAAAAVELSAAVAQLRAWHGGFFLFCFFFFGSRKEQSKCAKMSGRNRFSDREGETKKKKVVAVVPGEGIYYFIFF